MTFDLPTRDEIARAQKAWIDRLQLLSLNRPILCQHKVGAEKWHICNHFSPIQTRTILPCEIVFDFDVKDWSILREEANKLLAYLKNHSIPYLLSWSGGSGIHIHIFLDASNIKPIEVGDIADNELARVDPAKVARETVFDAIIRECGITKAAKLDRLKVAWSAEGSGSMIREFGAIREDNGYKTLLQEIPKARPKPGEYPLVFPESVSLWSIDRFEDVINTTIKRKLTNARNEVPNSETYKGQLASIPCYARLMEGLEEGQRNQGAYQIARFNWVVGIPLEEAKKDILWYSANCQNPGPEVERSNLSALKSAYEKSSIKKIGCAGIREIFGNEICEKKKCPLWHGCEAQGSEASSKSEAQTLADVVIRAAKKVGIEPFLDQHEEAFAAIENNGHREIVRIRSSRFTLWLQHLFYKENNGKSLNKEATSQAQSTFEAMANFEGARNELNYRIAWLDSDLWYDLCDDDWRAVRISPSIEPDGWEIVERPPILFKREKHMLPQVVPNPGGDWADFLKCLNLPMEEFGILCKSHLIQLFIDGHPRPALDLYNRKGAGKTITSELIRRIIDPSIANKNDLRDRDRNINNVFDQNYLPVFDNVEEVPEYLADKICRAITGEASQDRLLHTNREQVLYRYQRTMIFTSVQPIGLEHSDLVQRLIYLSLPYISQEERKDEGEIFRSFNASLPNALGYIFSTISKALAAQPTVKLDNLPRMADYALWGEAIARTLGEPEGSFIEQYKKNIRQGVDETLNANPLAQAIIQFMEDRKELHYIGTFDDLFNKLSETAKNRNLDIKSKSVEKQWPGASNALSRKMPQIVDDLKEYKIYYAKKPYRDLSDETKGIVGEGLASNRQIALLIKAGSPFVKEIPPSERSSDKKDDAKRKESEDGNDIEAKDNDKNDIEQKYRFESQQTKNDEKNDITIFLGLLSGRVAGGQQRALDISGKALEKLFYDIKRDGRDYSTLDEISFCLVPVEGSPGDRSRASGWFCAACERGWLPYSVTVDGRVLRARNIG